MPPTTTTRPGTNKGNAATRPPTAATLRQMEARLERLGRIAGERSQAAHKAFLDWNAALTELQTARAGAGNTT